MNSPSYSNSILEKTPCCTRLGYEEWMDFFVSFMYVNTLQDSACFQDFSPIFHILVSIWQLMWVGVQQIGKSVFIDTGGPLNFSRLCAIHSVSVHFDVHNYQRKDFLNVLTIGFMICKLTHVNKKYLIWWLWYTFRRTVLFFFTVPVGKLYCV